MGGGKEVDNEDTMPEKTIKPAHVQDGTKLCTVSFLSRSIVAIEKDKATCFGRFA
jgi:hypothetical protein